MPATVDIPRIAFAQREYRTTPPIEDPTILARHPLATDFEYNTLFSNEADATNFGHQVLLLRKVDRWTWACYISKKSYPGLEVGQTIRISYPRFGFEAGEDFIIKRIKTDSNALFDEIALFGPRGADPAVYDAFLDFMRKEYWQGGNRFATIFTEGPNLFTDGDLSEGSAAEWQVDGLATVSVDNGRLKVLNDGAGWAYRLFNVVVGKKYKFSANYIDTNSGGGRLRVGTGIGVSSYLSTNSAGPVSVEFRPTTTPIYVSLGDLSGGTGDVNLADDFSLVELPNEGVTSLPGFTYSRANNVGFIDSDGTVKFYESGIPPINGRGYHPTISVTNQLAQSQTFDQWSKHNPTVIVDSAVAPDGSMTADKIVSGSSNALQWIFRASLATATGQWTYSCFAKAGEWKRFTMFAYDGAEYRMQATFNLETGVVESKAAFADTFAYIIPLADGWYRCVVVATTASTGFGTTSGWCLQPMSPIGVARAAEQGNGVNGLYVWQAQAQTGHFIDGGPVLVTVASSANVGNSSMSANLPNVLAGDFFVEGVVNFTMPEPSFSFAEVENSGSVSNNLWLQRLTGSGAIRIIGLGNSVIGNMVNDAGMGPVTSGRMAFIYTRKVSTNDIGLAVRYNGQTFFHPGMNSSQTIVSGLDRLKTDTGGASAVITEHLAVREKLPTDAEIRKRLLELLP